MTYASRALFDFEHFENSMKILCMPRGGFAKLRSGNQGLTQQVQNQQGKEVPQKENVFLVDFHSFIKIKCSKIWESCVKYSFTKKKVYECYISNKILKNKRQLMAEIVFITLIRSQFINITKTFIGYLNQNQFISILSA